MQISTDLMLIMDNDAPSLAVLRAAAARLGCDLVEPNGVEELTAVLEVRRPTLAVLAVDGLETDGYGVLRALAQHGARPATVLVGTVNTRVLASIRRAAEARGLCVVGTRNRPLEALDIEKLLMNHVSSPPPIERDELVHGLAEQEFSLRYQPKIALRADSLTMQGVEALVRWQHPRRGELRPRHFLSAVESNGLVGELTDFVITDSIRQAGAWRSAGMPLEMVINLSPRLVKDRGFPDRLAALLREYDVPPDQIVLDVTETAGAEDRDLMLDVFTRLRILGVGLSLDNFGTGVSSLIELYRMPFSEIKVDHALLSDVRRERDAEIVVRAITDLAHRLELCVCAEGVETREMLDFARSAEFDTAQGQLFCDAVPAKDIERLVREWPESSPAATGAWRNLEPTATHDSSITRRLKRIRLASLEDS